MFEDVKMLKAGQSGHGMLIEHDAGYINPNDERNKEFITEIKKITKGTIVNDPLVLYVVLQKWGVLNRNGRIYPEHILKQQNEAYQQLIKENRAFGELDHPETSIISGDRISHDIIETWWDGKTLMGKLEINTTPGFINLGIASSKGDEVANLLRRGKMIGVSSRGVGSLEEDAEGNQVVQDDFELIGWDVVTTPSTPGSWMFNDKEDARPFMESKENKKNLLTDKLNKFLLG